MSPLFSGAIIAARYGQQGDGAGGIDNPGDSEEDRRDDGKHAVMRLAEIMIAIGIILLIIGFVTKIAIVRCRLDARPGTPSR